MIKQEFIGIHDLADTVVNISREGVDPVAPNVSVDALPGVLPEYAISGDGVLQTTLEDTVTLELLPVAGGGTYFLGSTPIRLA